MVVQNRNMKAVLMCLLVSHTSSMRLDLEDLQTPQRVSVESGTVDRPPILLPVAPGMDMCTNFINSKLERDAHFIDEGDFRLSNDENGADLLAGLADADLYPSLFFKKFTDHIRPSPYYLQYNGKFGYPEWDSDDVEYKFYIQTLCDDTTKVVSHWRNLPANRRYMLVVGDVERENDDDTDHFTKASEACSKDNKVEYRFTIDIWNTGDDFTEWPHTKFNMMDAEVIYHEDSQVRARIGDVEFEGKLGKILGGSSSQKAYWVVDVTFVDKQDYIVTDRKAVLETDDRKACLGGGARDGFCGHTFWWAFEEIWEDLNQQAKMHSLPSSEDGFLLITKVENKKVSYNGDGKLYDPLADKAATVGTEKYFQQRFSWSSEDHKTTRVMPVVACGLFNKVWKSKCCAKGNKPESEG